jgi:hypothetical protein
MLWRDALEEKRETPEEPGETLEKWSETPEERVESLGE